MDYLKLLDYQTWADEKVFEMIEQLSEPEINKKIGQYTSIKDRIAHITIALEVWYDRLNGFSPATFPDYSRETSAEIISKWREYNTKLATHFSQRRPTHFIYKNSSGEQFKNSYEDTLWQIINHTTAYRSQILMMIRILGYPVESVDYIYYIRSINSNL